MNYVLNRSIWPRTQESICMIAFIVRKNSNPIRTCISTSKMRIPFNGVPIERRNHGKAREKLISWPSQNVDSNPTIFGVHKRIDLRFAYFTRHTYILNNKQYDISHSLNASKTPINKRMNKKRKNLVFLTTRFK